MNPGRCDAQMRFCFSLRTETVATHRQLRNGRKRLSINQAHFQIFSVNALSQVKNTSCDTSVCLSRLPSFGSPTNYILCHIYLDNGCHLSMDISTILFTPTRTPIDRAAINQSMFVLIIWCLIRRKTDPCYRLHWQLFVVTLTIQVQTISDLATNHNFLNYIAIFSSILLNKVN